MLIVLVMYIIVIVGFVPLLLYMRQLCKINSASFGFSSCFYGKSVEIGFNAITASIELAPDIHI